MIQGSHPVWIDSFEATEAISKFAVVVHHSTGKVKAPAAAKASGIVGIAQEAATQSGDVIPVVRLGTSYVIADAAIAVGKTLTVNDTTGRVRDGQIGTSLVSGDGVVGTLDEASEASGDYVVAFINPRQVIS